MPNLILPGDYLFAETLANIPSFWNKKRDLFPDENGAIIYDSNTGLPRVATWKETEEYLHDGEYDLRMAQIDAEDKALEWSDHNELLNDNYEITDDDLRANWEFMKQLGRI